MMPRFLLAVALIAPLLAITGANAQELTGTLKKVKDSKTVTLGYRESSIPFSYVNKVGEPIGYSIELCRKLVEAMGETLGKELQLKWLAVTSETRIDAIVSGRADLECGSTTSNLERQKVVAFSPVIFVVSGVENTSRLTRRKSQMTIRMLRFMATREKALGLWWP